MRRTLFLLALAALLVPIAPAAPRIYHSTITKTLASGSTLQVTTDLAIWSRKVTIQSAAGNTETVYVGDVTLTGSTNALYSLVPGQGVTLLPSKKYDEEGERFRLSDWYLRGTTSDLVYVTYEVRSAT